MTKVTLNISHASRFLKPEYSGKPLELDFNDRRSVVKTFMDAFLEREYSEREVAVISGFLKRKGLTRAEIHAVMFHLGYRYTTMTSPLTMHLKVGKYLHNKPFQVVVEEKREKERERIRNL
jgi:hypothetical protein